MRYAACNELVHDRPFAEACALIARHGYQGIELAPYSLADDPLQIPPARAREIRQTIWDAGLECVGLHWLLKAPLGLHITTPDIGVRRRSWDAVRSLVNFCREVGGSLVVLGSGKQRGTQGISRDAATAILRDELAGLAPHLAQSGVTVLLEPLQVQVTDVLNTLEEARGIIRELQCPRIASMLDFHNSQDEHQPWEELVATHADIIRHVHLNEVDGHHPSLVGRSDRARSAYAAAFRALTETGYGGWISLETFHAAESPEAVLTETRAFLNGMESALHGGASGPQGAPSRGGSEG
jgi:D-psicose/D-tagatose/L-ribulose 3-epimerase